MQTHFRSWTVEIDQAGLRRGSVLGKLSPGLQQDIRHRRPGPSGYRMCRLVTITLFIGHPTERSAVRHPHREWAARFRHPRCEQGRFGKNLTERGEECRLGGSVEVAGKDAQSAKARC